MDNAPRDLVIRNARVLTLSGGERPRRGAALGELDAHDATDVLVEDRRIARIGTALRVPVGAKVIDARGRVLMPGFLDAHTHACWAGDRLGEWERKLAGATYLELLEAGGGIMSTVRAVRAATENELADHLLGLLNVMLRHGTTTVEVKSGYGLDTATELKMLRAITRAGARWPGTVVPTACIGHALDPDVPRDQFIARVLDETLPAVHEAFPGVAIDAYCERGAWSLDECLTLMDLASALGHSIRIHADQFNDLGVIPEAVERGWLSVDHLEASSPASLRALAGSNAFGVMLPCSGFHLDGRYADGRAFVDAGGALVIGTNCNPGSAPCASIPMAIALAARHLGLTAAEAIGACTVNAATLMGLPDRGVVEPGARADLVLLRHTDERSLAFEFGSNPVDAVIVNGDLVDRERNAV